MKTPEEIKKGLECYFPEYCDKGGCRVCKRKIYTPGEVLCNLPIRNALSYIRQLEANYNQVSKVLCGKENATVEEI